MYPRVPLRSIHCYNPEAPLRPCLSTHDIRSEILSTPVSTDMESGVMKALKHHRIEPFDTSVAQPRDYFGSLLRSRPCSAKKPGG